MQRILVLRGGALGDFLVTLPALAALRRRWPKACIELIGNATAAALASRRGIIDAVHSQHEARWHPLFGATPLPAALAEWLEHFDLILNYWPDPDGELRRRFPLRASQLFLSTTALPGQGLAASHYAAPLEELGIKVNTFIHPLEPLSHSTASLPLPIESTSHSGLRPGAVAIHPGSGSARKNWPLESWQALCTALGGVVPNRELLIVTGEADVAATQSLADTGLQAHLWPLEALISAFSDARLFIGHDSGISHLAAATGVPCILLFGPTDPAIWAPPAPNVQVIRRGSSLTDITVAEVEAAALRLLRHGVLS